MNRLRQALLGLLLLALAACGTPAGPQFDSHEQAAWAGAVCTDGGWVRVPDYYCPIGDEPVENQQYFWRYRPYAASAPDIDVVYVGYQVDRAAWTDRRPAYVSTLHIDRGRFPEQPLAGQPRTSTARVTTAAAVKRSESDRAKGVERGGLGVAAQGGQRSSVALVDAKRTERKAIAPPPAGKRAMATAKASTKSGGRK